MVILWDHWIDKIGFHIPVIRQLSGMVFLTLIPGIIILRILKLHQLNTIESLLYSVGISLLVVMLSGFLVNLILPILGLLKPLSLMPILGILSVESVILLILFCISCPDYVCRGHDIRRCLGNLRSNAVVVILGISIITFSILGAYFVNINGSNVFIRYVRNYSGPLGLICLKGDLPLIIFWFNNLDSFIISIVS